MNDIEAAIVYGDIVGGSSSTRNYPSYAKNEKNAVKARINTLLANIQHPIVLGYITDPHMPKVPSQGADSTRDEITYGMLTLVDLTKEINFDLVVWGGDSYGGSSPGTIANMQESANYVNNVLNDVNCPFAMLVGNHEGGQDNTSITRDEVFLSHVTKSGITQKITFVDKISGYMDDSTKSIRYIFLDAYPRNEVSYTTANVNTVLATMLSGMPSGYKAIIFSHHPIDENLPQVSGRKGWNNPTACHDTLQTYKDKILFCVNGHVHNNLKVSDLYGVSFIATTCCGRYELNDGSTRTLGTVDCTAYDVFVVDPDNEVVYAVRYGNGDDREISIAHSMPTLDCFQGTLSGETGELVENANRVYTATVPILHKEFHVEGFGNGYWFGGRVYDADGDFVISVTDGVSGVYYKNSGECSGSWGITDDVTIHVGSAYESSAKQLKLIIRTELGTDALAPSDVNNKVITVDGIEYKLTAFIPPEPTLNCYQGTINGSTGAVEANANRVYTAEIPITNQEFHVTGFGNGYWFGGRFYDASDDYVVPLTDSVYSTNVYFKNAGEHDGSWGTASDVTVHIGSSVLSRITKMHIVVRTETGDAITPSDVEDLEITVDGNTYILTEGT